jgi:chromosome segregation ATPase
VNQSISNKETLEKELNKLSTENEKLVLEKKILVENSELSDKIMNEQIKERDETIASLRKELKESQTKVSKKREKLSTLKKEVEEKAKENKELGGNLFLNF